jgi:hypothetical protein
MMWWWLLLSGFAVLIAAAAICAVGWEAAYLLGELLDEEESP